MLKVGLTGGISSGKSAVANLLAAAGAIVIDTDVIARELVTPGEPALNALVDTFGNDILGSDGALDRAKLRRLVFADGAKRQQLENILHPRIRERTLQAIAAAEGHGGNTTSGKYIVVVVPLLVESGFAELVDRVLVVDAAPELQQQRLMARDAVDAQLAGQMISQQASREQRLQAADDVLANNGELTDLREQVAALHAQYCEIAAGRRDAKL